MDYQIDDYRQIDGWIDRQINDRLMDRQIERLIDIEIDRYTWKTVMPEPPEQYYHTQSASCIDRLMDICID